LLLTLKTTFASKFHRLGSLACSGSELTSEIMNLCRQTLW